MLLNNQWIAEEIKEENNQTNKNNVTKIIKKTQVQN